MGTTPLRIGREALRWHAVTMWQIARTSLGGIGQMVVAMTAWIFLMRIPAGVSTEAVAGTTIAMRVMMFTLMQAWSMFPQARALARIARPEEAQARCSPRLRAQHSFSRARTPGAFLLSGRGRISETAHRSLERTARTFLVGGGRERDGCWGVDRAGTGAR